MDDLEKTVVGNLYLWLVRRLHMAVWPYFLHGWSKKDEAKFYISAPQKIMKRSKKN